jgi:hypothetical protein
MIEWSASRPVRFTTVKRGSGTYWIGGWVDPRAGLRVMEKRKELIKVLLSNYKNQLCKYQYKRQSR